MLAMMDINFGELNTIILKILSNLSSATDQELVALLNKSDYAGFTEIFDRYHHLLLNHAYNKLRNKEEANVVVQDIFIKLWHSRRDTAIQDLSDCLFDMVRDSIFLLLHQKQVNLSHAKASNYLINNNDTFSDQSLRLINDLVKD